MTWRKDGLLMTECNEKAVSVKRVGKRNAVADFGGGTLTSDGGVLLLGEVDEAIGLIECCAACFTDHRDPDLIEHTVADLIRQRVFAVALGYEDVNDHDELSRDPLLATVVGKDDPTGQGRARGSDKNRPLAGKSTLNRLELTAADAGTSERYKKIVLNVDALRQVFVKLFLDSYDSPPKEIVLDFDATDDPLHGRQEGRFFHGYYREYCYLPLYVFSGEELLAAELRPSSIDASAGMVEVLEPLVVQVRTRWPEVRIIVRGDSGFAREEIMSWCEEHSIDYVFGLPKNSRLVAQITEELWQVRQRWEQTGQAARLFKDFSYRTLNSWSRERRVVGKAEHLEKGANPRFVVTSLSCDEWEAAELYEQLYCARGEMENRIKEQQLYLFADRTSAATIRANQIRLWFSSLAYVLLNALRRLGLSGTQMARARCDTIRLKLLKIGAAVRVSVRRVWVRLASSFPLKELFWGVLGRLQQAAQRRGALPMRC